MLRQPNATLRRFYAQKSGKKKRWLRQGLGELVHSFEADHEAQPAKIAEARYVTSYNWLDRKKPTIRVPGCPRIWVGPVSSQLPADYGMLSYADENGARMKKVASPLLPIFAAVRASGMNVNFSELDLITDRSNLRALLRWARGSYGKRFRIDIDMIGNTLLLTRRGPQMTRYNSGYGRQYELATTEYVAGHEDDGNHFRIHSIDLDGLKVLIRFEVDACTPFGALLSTDPPPTDTSLTLSDLSFFHQYISVIHGIEVVNGGARPDIPHSALIEIKTKSMGRSLGTLDVCAQVYLAQTHNVYVGVHKAGTFKDLRRLSLNDDNMREYVVAIEERLGTVKAFLLQLGDLIRGNNTEVGFSLICDKRQLLLYRRIKSKSVKPLKGKVFSRASEP